MIDSVLKGTGNSRFLKSAVPAGTSWADALAMLQAGTFPIDFNGINAEGFQQVGTPLNKANLLKDATAAQIGLPSSTTPDGMFQALGNTGELHVWRKTTVTPAGTTTTYPVSTNPNMYQEGSDANTTIEYFGKLGDKARVQVVSYVGTGTYGESNPNSLTFNFAPKIVKFLFQVEVGIGNHSKIENFQQDGEQYYMVSDRLTTEFAQGEGFGYNSYAVRGKKSADGKTFTWYTGIGSQAQGNQQGMKYYFIAIG